MKKIDELTVDVKTRMYVPKTTADACLALVSLYLNEHRNKKVKCVRNDDGSYEYRIVEEEDD